MVEMLGNMCQLQLLCIKLEMTELGMAVVLLMCFFCLQCVTTHSSHRVEHRFFFVKGKISGDL